MVKPAQPHKLLKNINMLLGKKRNKKKDMGHDDGSGSLDRFYS